MPLFTLTRLRADILSILQQANKPMKAYDVLAQLRKIRPNAKPPTVYRVLDFLKNKDVIHEITHQHAYLACHGNSIKNEHPTTLLLICSQCNEVSEEQATTLSKSLLPLAKEYQFKPTVSTIELLGLCQQCQ